MNDTFPLDYHCNVVYRLPCKDCNKTYIGQTKQNLKARLTEHKYLCKEKHKNKIELVH